MVVSNQDKLRPGQFVRERKIGIVGAPLADVTPPLYIALRFLCIASAPCCSVLAGVVFGVAIFIGTQAQTQGFAKYFIDSTLGSNGALVVRSRFPSAKTPLPWSRPRIPSEAAHRRYFEGIDDASAIMRVSRQFSNVVSCSPVLRGTLSARAGFENATVDLFGIDPALHLQTTDLSHQIVAEVSMIFGIIRTQSFSVHAWPTP